MKNMNLSQMTLVSPKIFPSSQANERASGADNILAQAKVVMTLEDALADCQWVFGTSGRSREFPWPQLSPREAAAKIHQFAQANQKVAVVFGNEQSGLSNEDLQLCDFHIAIPSNPEFSSLNLASAVQVISYEIYQRFIIEENVTKNSLDLLEKATKAEVLGLLQQFEETAIAIEFLDPKHPKKLLPRIKRLFTKAQLEKEEINILRGFLKKVQSNQS